ncbi:MAG: hypothetical protein AAB471_00310 [Patescibacteria group bacterium]
MDLQEFKRQYVQQELGISEQFGKIFPPLRFLKQKGKKVILIKGGHVVHHLKSISDIVISAQNIKKHITGIKQKPGVKPGLADRNPESTGRTTLKS